MDFGKESQEPCQSAGLCVARRELGAINAVRESVRQEQKDPPSQPGPLNQFGRTESNHHLGKVSRSG